MWFEYFAFSTTLGRRGGVEHYIHILSFSETVDVISPSTIIHHLAKPFYSILAVITPQPISQSRSTPTPQQA